MSYVPKFFRGNPIIQPGETYKIDGELHKVITATSHIVDSNADSIGMTEPLFWLDNLETNERVYIGEKELQSKFKDISNLH
ncbi:hypothetical protein [Psychrobacillus sp. FSL K6-1267]|uniref:hypothetical protein n=1 Tax=Psychrobacillus sp. FSL K6-1267 TaxID=2921543 RepID=UPI0030F6BCE0